MLHRPVFQIAYSGVHNNFRFPSVYIRCKSSVIVNQTTVGNERSSAEIVDFRNAKTAFAATTTFELLRSAFVFHLCSYKFIVNHNKKLMEIAQKVFGTTLFQQIMKATFYGQFVAGEDEEKIQHLIRRYRRYGVKSILDYSVEKDIPEGDAEKRFKDSYAEAIHVPEVQSRDAIKQFQPSFRFADRSKDVVSARTYFYESESKCDENMQIFMRCIDASSQSVEKEGFTAIKVTALGRPQFLLQFSDFLIQMERIFKLIVSHDHPDTIQTLNSSTQSSIDLENFQKRLEHLGVEISYDKTMNCFTLLDTSGDGVIDLLEWLHFKHYEYDLASIFQVRNKQTGKMEQLVPTLTEEGIEQMRNMLQRLDTLAQYAKSKGVRLMIDAEHSYFQPAIRRLTMEMMRRFNQHQTVVYNTYQCYTRSALNQLQMDMKMAEVHDFYFGAKLVRGAYIEQERKRAAELGYPDPINSTFEATTKMYEDCLEESFQAMHRRPRGRVSIMVATHNENTVRFALKRMKEHGILPEHKLICFGQLLGMCDQVSFPLGAAGYSVYKYVPYGPVKEVLPYLSRRAYENQSMLSNVSVERKLRWSEIRRRFTSNNIIYYP